MTNGNGSQPHADPTIYYAPKPGQKKLDEQFHFDSKTPVHNNLNKMLTAIEMRLSQLDALFVTQEQVIDSLVQVGLQRMDDVFTPLINAAVERLNTLGVQFSAPSTTSNPISMGQKTFTIPSPQKDAYIYGSHVNIHHDATNYIIASIVNYDRPSGVLTVDPVLTSGTGTYNSWVIDLTAPPDVLHATRTDNPHATTAEQVGAYTKAAADSLMSAIVTAALQRNANLLDVGNAAAARANLGLGDAATKTVGTSAANVPTVSLMGSSIFRDAGYAENQVPVLQFNGMVACENLGVGFVPEGRLTLEPGVPVQANRNLGPKTVINYTPYMGKHVPVWNGQHWMRWPIVSPTDTIGLILDIGGNAYWPVDKNFDLFVAYIASSNGIWLGTGPAWQTNTLRGVGVGTAEIEMWHGLPVNKYPLAQFASAHGIDLNIPARQAFWVGTFRTSANGTTRMDFAPPAVDGGSHPKLFLWNRYHKLLTTARCLDSKTFWPVDPASIPLFGSMQRVDNSPNTRISWVCGEAGSRVNATMHELVTVHDIFRTSIAYDETELSPVGGLLYLSSPPATMSVGSDVTCEHRRTSDAGFHFMQFCEGAAGSTVNVNGPNFSGHVAMDM